MKLLIKTEHIITVSILIVFFASIMIALSISNFKPNDLENTISTQLQLKEELLKTYKFPEVKSSIFSPIVIIQEKPKVVEPVEVRDEVKEEKPEVFDEEEHE